MTDMTPEELQAYRDAQYASTAPASWIWSEEEMAWLPPIPAPQDNQPYFWNEENKTWDLAPGYPLTDEPQGE